VEISFVDVGFGAVGETWEELVKTRTDGMCVHTHACSMYLAFTIRRNS
jgi:hypothetical protein